MHISPQTITENEGSGESGDELLSTLGPRLRELRRTQNLTLEMLAHRAQVSRAMISKIERGEKMPTVGILVRIATGLNVSLSALLGEQPQSAAVQLQRANRRTRFRDPSTGFEREAVFSPAEAGDVELVRHVLPGLQSTGLLSPYPVPTRKLIFSPSGPLVVKIGDETFWMEPGDALRFDVTSAYSFSNPEAAPVSYYLFMSRHGGA
ncbi:helix-turn-helix domain-containing protein [Microvirga splendida]|uniref:Helix-turn-helix domain-containing protein n=1 Tax=Microvirga splendida TaxID=2795727 RepID=A0ABS0XUV1_9HYPH|nr:XRE family transcriptional regulator [Microvirga splendida]MBJ6123821.1 helix-turn-helix domain-containing protein [Microvirga splendida]